MGEAGEAVTVIFKYNAVSFESKTKHRTNFQPAPVLLLLKTGNNEEVFPFHTWVTDSMRVYWKVMVLSINSG